MKSTIENTFAIFQNKIKVINLKSCLIVYGIPVTFIVEKFRMCVSTN